MYFGNIYYGVSFFQARSALDQSELLWLETEKGLSNKTSFQSFKMVNWLYLSAVDKTNIIFLYLLEYSRFSFPPSLENETAGPKSESHKV